MNSFVATLGVTLLLVASCTADGGYGHGGHFFGGHDSIEIIGGGGYGGYGGGHRRASIVPAIGGLVHTSTHGGGYGSFGGHSIEHGISFGGHRGGGYNRPSYSRQSYSRPSYSRQSYSRPSYSRQSYGRHY